MVSCNAVVQLTVVACGTGIVLPLGHKLAPVSCTYSRKCQPGLSDVGSCSELSTFLVATIRELFVYRQRRTRGRILSFRHSRMPAHGSSLGGAFCGRSGVFVDKYRPFWPYCSPANAQEASFSSKLEVSLRRRRCVSVRVSISVGLSQLRNL